MRRLICLLGAVVVTLAGVPSGTGANGPELTLAGSRPLVLRGHGFKPYERARVVVVARLTRAKNVRASSSGSFTVRFVALSIPRCGGVFATARGRAGTVARLKIPLPACQPVSKP